MTNLRDALEKAGVTPEGISDKISSAASGGVDKIVDDIAKLATPSASAAHPSVEDDRPKLVEDNSEFAGVVDRIEQLVTGESDEATASETTDEADAAPTADEVTNEVDESPAATTLTNESPAPPPIDIGSIPMLKTDSLTDKTAPAAAAEAAAAINGDSADPNDFQATGGYADDLQSIDNQDDGLTSQISPSLPAEGVEVPALDPLGVESEMAIDPNQQATYEEYDEYELVTNDEADVSKGDTVGFKPSLVPSMSPGRAVSVTTTEEPAYEDPVATANEITGSYEPQDLSQLDDTAPTFGRNAETPEVDSGPSPSFLDTTNLQTTQPDPPAVEPEESNYSLATSGIAAAALLASSSNRPAPEPLSSPDDFSELEPAPSPIAEEATPDPVPSLASVASITGDTPTAFEQHLLQNLTNESTLEQYKQTAEAALNPDRTIAPKTICFVSVESASHATEVVAHLGVIYSTQKKKRVLIVDASDVPDSLTRAFRKDKQPGLKNMTGVNDDWADMVLSTAIPNLFLMPHGWRRGSGSHWKPENSPASQLSFREITI